MSRPGRNRRFLKVQEEFEHSNVNVFSCPAYQNLFSVTNIYTNASHAAGVRVYLEGADGGNEDTVNIGGLLRLLLSSRTAGLQVPWGLQK